MNNIVTILCSGMGLGFYIPGLLIKSQLKEMGISTHEEVFESYLTPASKQKTIQSKSAYNEDFGIAQVAARMPFDIRKYIDHSEVLKLIDMWKNENRKNFILLSGHWVPIIDMYADKLATRGLNIDLLQVDADLSPSWKHLKKIANGNQHNYNNICLYDRNKNVINYEIPILKKDQVRYSQRSDFFTLHGGGWGMGTYKEKIEELNDMGFSLNIVAYKEDEVDFNNKMNRYYMIKPGWCAWDKNMGHHEFPPFAEIISNNKPDFKNRAEYHELFEIISESKAIISKPGAGTLIDSLGSATPVIMLEPFGSHEKSNFRLWEFLGYGISYNQWEKTGFLEDILEEMQLKLHNSRGLYKSYCNSWNQII